MSASTSAIVTLLVLLALAWREARRARRQLHALERMLGDSVFIGRAELDYLVSNQRPPTMPDLPAADEIRAAPARSFGRPLGRMPMPPEIAAMNHGASAADVDPTAPPAAPYPMPPFPVPTGYDQLGLAPYRPTPPLRPPPPQTRMRFVRDLLAAFWRGITIGLGP